MDLAVRKSDLSIETKASRLAIDGFLTSVQRRALAMARAALGNTDDAMDAVQDSMLQLVKSYADRDVEDRKSVV